MSLPLRVFLIAISLLFLAFVLFMLRRDRFLLKYSISWLALAVLGVLAAVFPGGVAWLADLLGFETPVNFIFLVVITLLMMASLVFGAALSKQSTLVKKLVQEISILRAEIDGTAPSEGDEPR